MSINNVSKNDRRRSLLANKLKDVDQIPGHPNFDRAARFGSRRSRLGSRSNSVSIRKISRFSSTSCGRQSSSWIEQKFHKRECIEFIPLSNEDKEKCGCGRHRHEHFFTANQNSPQNLRWSIRCHTRIAPTDAFGTIEFQGGPHPHKAQYIRLSFDSDPANICYLLENVWDLPKPKLVITVHGGITNFNLQPKLARAFRSGLLKAAKTTGAWIITSGLNTGVVRYVASALCETGAVRSKDDIVTIGIAPWGLLKKRQIFVGRDVTVQYHPKAFSTRSRFAILNDKHSYFLLVDNGTVGRYGADIILRSRLEEFISRQSLENVNRNVPVVGVVLEGGTCTIRSVLDYVTNSVPIPVVICDGSGRAADLLAYAHKCPQTDGYNRHCKKTVDAAEEAVVDFSNVPETVRDTLIATIQNCFQYSLEQAEKLYSEILLCVRKKDLVTVFRLGEEDQIDIDHAILTALLKGQRLSLPDQLSLVLTWNRADIARSDIFTYGRDWPPGALETAMMEALHNDRVEFVKLLLENGVQMEKFLTFQRLEELYNSQHGPLNTLGFIVRDVVNVYSNYKYVLQHIGLVIEKLMGGAYESSYRSPEFIAKYGAAKKRAKLKLSVYRGDYVLKPRSDTGDTPLLDQNDYNPDTQEPHFKFPFNDLFLWAVLTKRQEMALCMWQHGEDALTKALIACRLYKYLALEAAEDYLEIEVCEDFKNYAKEFKKLALDLLEQCYQTDRDFTLQLLTYEMESWGRQTNISLAVLATHKDFLAHPCCQILLSDLWHGGLRIRKYTNVKVLACLLLPPFILSLDFKTKEQLSLQPQTTQEYNEHIRNKSESDDDDWIQNWMEVGHFESTSGAEDGEALMRVRHYQSSSRRSSLVNHKSSGGHGGVHIFIDGTHAKKSNDLSARSQTTADMQQDLRSMKGMDKIKPSTTTLPSLLKETIYQLPSNFNFVERPLPPTKKFYEFYVAPLTTFWLWTIAYGFFLFAFTYTVLTKLYPLPKWQEWYTIAYVLTLTCENIRRLVITEGRTLKVKLIVYFQYRWNICYSIAIWCFFFALILRFTSVTIHYAHVVYACDIVFWYILVLDLMSVHHKLGVYVSMMGKMVSNMFYLVCILFVVLCSFGVVRQSIHFPHNDWDWQMARNIVYKPYFMLYGEVYAGEIDTCGDQGVDCDIVGHWLTPAYMAAFMMIANILIINVMIAVFNYIFLDVNAQAQQVWKFSRYRVVLDYEYKPFLAPPFIIFYHIFFVMKYCCRRKKDQQRWFDYALKLFLNADGVEAVHDFEESCMEDYYHQREDEKCSSLDERVKRTNDRVEFVSMKLDDLSDKLNFTKAAMQKIERKQLDIIEAIKDIVLMNKLSVGSRSPVEFSDNQNVYQTSTVTSSPKPIKFNIIEEDEEPEDMFHGGSPTDKTEQTDLSHSHSEVVRKESAPSPHPDNPNWRLLLDRCKSVPAKRDVVPEDENKEYSTILDHSANVSANNSVLSMSPYDSFIGNLYEPPSSQTIRKNANSFVMRENQLLREYEEDGSVVAGSLLNKRIRTTSISLGADGAHDLLEMGYDEEPDDFLKHVPSEDKSTTSTDSLNSSHMEGPEQLREINETLQDYNRKDSGKLRSNNAKLSQHRKEQPHRKVSYKDQVSNDQQNSNKKGYYADSESDSE